MCPSQRAAEAGQWPCPGFWILSVRSSRSSRSLCKTPARGHLLITGVAQYPTHFLFLEAAARRNLQCENETTVVPLPSTCTQESPWLWVSDSLYPKHRLDAIKGRVYTAGVSPWHTMDLQFLRMGSPENHQTCHTSHCINYMAETTAQFLEHSHTWPQTGPHDAQSHMKLSLLPWESELHGCNHCLHKWSRFLEKEASRSVQCICSFFGVSQGRISRSSTYSMGLMGSKIKVEPNFIPWSWVLSV